jgi:predicted DsbA family dithiol-disulfide isomerase
VQATSATQLPQFHKDLIAAHFALGEDLELIAVIDRHASASGIEIAGLHAALADFNAAAALKESGAIARRHGVQGTPAWLLDGRLLVGLRSAAEFESFAEHAVSR